MPLLRAHTHKHASARVLTHQRMGFDGTTGARENEFVASFAEKTMKAQHARGGERGGLGRTANLPRVARPVEAPCLSAPCDIDASRQRGNPAKVYYGITVEFPFETPMVPQDQVGHSEEHAVEHMVHTPIYVARCALGQPCLQPAGSCS